jgi:oligopeptidase B
MQNIRIVDLNQNDFDSFHYVNFSDGIVYSLWPSSVDEEVADLSKASQYDTNILRFTYSSFTQPRQIIDYNMDTRVRTVVHEQMIMGPGYNPDLYVSKRLWATGVDGTAIPISIVYRHDLMSWNASHADMEDNKVPSTNILLLHGYGAYGSCMSPTFNASRLSLLDRGFIYAIAHVRGGSEMGNAWYQEGKLEKKPNTFRDFISVAEFLINEGYTSKEKLAIYGRSAGGLLIGAVVNMRPDLFKAVLTEVPFVDVINTMFDSSIPWT